MIIRATNLEAGVEIRVPAEIHEPGIVAVSAHVLAQTIRAVSAEKIDLRLDESNLLIESRGTKTLIKAVPHNEFPTLSSNESKGVPVSRMLLISGIQSVVYAASPSMIRPELGSVYVSMNTSGIVTAATDSFRLAEKTISGAQ